MEITQSYDGDGGVARRVQVTRQETFEQTEQGPVLTNIWTQEKINYHLSSTVLGGVLVAELEAYQGALGGRRLSIYANGRRIARETGYFGNIDYEHINPATGGWVTSGANPNDRLSQREERDPMGAELPLSDPLPGLTFLNLSEGRLYLEGGDPFDLSGGCTLDGMPVNCNKMAEMLRSGAAQGRSAEHIAISCLTSRPQANIWKISNLRGIGLWDLGE